MKKYQLIWKGVNSSLLIDLEYFPVNKMIE